MNDAGQMTDNKGMKTLLFIVLVVIALFVIPVFLIMLSNYLGPIPDNDSWHGFISGRYYGRYQVEVEYAIYVLSLLAFIVAEVLIHGKGNNQLRRVQTLPLILFLLALGFVSPYMNYLGVSQCTNIHPNFDAAVSICNNSEYKDTEYAAWFCKRYCENDPLKELDHSRSIRMLTLLAKTGHAQSQAVLGDFYLNGHRGLNQDLQKAEYWLMKAALQDVSDAQNLLGWYYTLGVPYGLTPDPDEALKWLDAAANNGHPAAMGHLFRVISTENTNEQKRKKASYWLDKLESIGEPRAKIWREEKKLK